MTDTGKHTHDPGNPIVNETGELCTDKTHYKTTTAAETSVSVDDSRPEDTNGSQVQNDTETKPAKLVKVGKK